jgi:hypothetical protein
LNVDSAVGAGPAGRLRLGLAGLFVGLAEGLKLLGERLYIGFVVTAAQGHAVADEELEEIVEKLGYLAGEKLELFPGDVVFGLGALFELALDEIVDELGAVHFTTVLVYLMDDILLDHHNQVVFIQEQGPSHFSSLPRQ